MPFYNCHIHIFSKQCAPERFLQVGLPGNLDFAAGAIKSFLETKLGQTILFSLKKLKGKGVFKRITKIMARYASFASVGTMSNQKMVFENILQFYPQGSRFVVLTLNMDHMGAGQSELTFQGQVDEVIQLRRLYPDTCLPFLSIDPRMGTQNFIKGFVEKYIGKDENGFCKPFVGVKLYPALGYFPFDLRLDAVFGYCEKNEIPIMTHCTPSGAFYVGQLDDLMGAPDVIGNPSFIPHRFLTKVNDMECDIFLNPKNWVPVLEKYRKLKICFAHMGGVGEIKKSQNNTASWYDDIIYLMCHYENIYTDISYTLSDQTDNYRIWREIAALLKGEKTGKHTFINKSTTEQKETSLPFDNTIKDRILFGTDYFMTEQEDNEKNLAVGFSKWLIKEFKNEGRLLIEKISEQNPERYLTSKFFTP